MKIKKISGSWGLLIVALVIGGAAFYMTNSYLTGKEMSLREQLLGKDEPMKDVVVATVDMIPGDVIGGQNMAVSALPAEHVSKYAITPDVFSQVDGHVIDQYMSRGEPLLTHFVKGGVISRFSELLEIGQRAVTLDIDEIASNSNMLTAGDYIDIFLLATLKDLSPSPSGEFDVKKSSAGQFIMPLLTRVKVIAIGPRSLKTSDQAFLYPLGAEGEQEDYGTVTIGVDVEDAAKIEIAKGMGKLVLMLRNAEDSQEDGIKVIDRSMVVSLGADLGGLDFYQFYGASQASGGTLVPQFKSVGTGVLLENNREWVKSLPINDNKNYDNKKSEAKHDQSVAVDSP